MKHLFLIRHAKSSWSDPACSDFDRPLNKRGKRDAPMMGQRLATAAVRPTVIVASPARRARKTAQAIGVALGISKKEIIYLENLYTFDMDRLITTVREMDEAVTSLGLVGHNYAITEYAEWLTEQQIGNIPTCGMVAIELEVKRWSQVGAGDGRLIFFDYPKLHTEQGGRG